MSGEALEAFLARLYVDEAARRRFRDDPSAEAERAGLAPAEREALQAIDWVGLDMAAASFDRKRAHQRALPWWRSLVAALGRLWGRWAPGR